MNSHDQRRQQITAPQSQPVSIPAKEEWVIVKRTRSTQKVRAQRRCTRAARARAIPRKVQESKVAKEPSRKVWVPKSVEKQPQTGVCTRDSTTCLAGRETARAVAPTARQSRQLRDSTKRRAQPRDSMRRRAHRRDTSMCLAQSPFTRDTSTCLGQRETIPNTSNCSSQTSSSSFRLSKYPEASQTSRVSIASRLSIPQGVREFIEENKVKHVTRKVIKDDQTLVIHSEAISSDEIKRLKVSTWSNSRYLQKKTCPPVRGNVTLGGGNIRKRAIDQINCSCSCAQLIKTLLSGCACSESNAHPQRASVFERLSLPTTQDSKPKSRRFRRKKRSAVQHGESPEVTINMVDKGKGTATDADPDFTPGGRVSPQIFRRLSRLQLRATKHIDYRKMHEGESSEDEISDSCSAVASDDTMSSVGQAREAFTITPETLAQMLQEALAKQKEELRAEIKTEVELAMQQMRELQSQKAAQPESGQQGGTSRRVAHDIEDSDTEVDEHIHADQPPNKTAEDLNHPTGGGLKQEEDDSGKMKELEGKINALMSAHKVKKMGIPCPYPREWDSIPYPAKFNLINFTPFDGRGSPTQHLIYFKSHLGVISGNEPLMVRSFVGTLRGAAFDWYRRLKAGSINCWDDMESSFLNNFFDDETEVSIGTLLDEKQKSGETIDAFVKRFRNKAINCKDPITEEFILQTCHNNLSIDLLEVMGVVPPTTWKDLKLRGEQAERFLRRKKVERGKTTADPSEVNFSSRNRGKTPVIADDVIQTSQLQPRQQLRGQQKASNRRPQEEYSFKDEEVLIIFKHLLDSNKIKLPPITNQEEADKTSDPKYCAYHRRILHPTKDCFALKAIIQALVDAGVITPK